MIEKPWYTSVTLWVNLLSIIVVAITMLMQDAGTFELSPQQVAVGAVVVAVLNMIIRIFTNQPIAGTPGAASLRRRARMH